MSVKSEYVPKSARGRRVARVLRAAGLDVRDRDVQGHHLCNIPGVDELTLEELKRVAFALDPEQAFYAEIAAYEEGQDLLDHADLRGVTWTEAWKQSERLWNAWPLERW